ncbi:short-chain dehydrogenase reductase SDR [Hygrophoropsis aurantiaca]|uniref:Short-chain dehydrogenase reductase SDR n=1 Tax=Hygrophoropsis aurantiaca TaxID=72124 RepID=A0ACB8A156_9AGAM|nr:short-chain dehydrogenase reductase SDR [Hygrophoropsis aurantiaca]
MTAPRTIFITGASSGIGLASAKLFYEQGWNVIATMRTPEKDTELKTLDSSRILVNRLDLQDYSSIEPAIRAGIEKFKTINLLLNNAGYGQGGIFECIPRELVQEQFDVNLFGLMDVTRTLLPHFRANGYGGVINVSSGAGFWSLPMSTMYNASKFALEGFTEALSYELQSQNVFVKSIVPHGGVTQTDFVDRFHGTSTAIGESPKSYDEFKARIAASYQKMIAGASVSSHDVTQTIYDAATDGKVQLRYFIGNDARGFLKARYESQSDEEYMTLMRAYFE